MERRSDGEGLDALLRTVDQVEEQVRHEYRGEDRGQKADDEGDGEALDGARAELEEKQRRHDGRHVGIDDRAHARLNPRSIAAFVEFILTRIEFNPASHKAFTASGLDPLVLILNTSAFSMFPDFNELLRGWFPTSTGVHLHNPDQN